VRHRLKPSPEEADIRTMVDSITGIGLRGVLDGLERAGKAASEASQALSPNGSGDLVSPLVDLKQAELQTKASAKIIAVGDELTKSVLDILA